MKITHSQMQRIRSFFFHNHKNYAEVEGELEKTILQFASHALKDQPVLHIGLSAEQSRCGLPVVLEVPASAFTASAFIRGDEDNIRFKEMDYVQTHDDIEPQGEDH